MRFFILFDQEAENIGKMAQQLNDMLDIWQNLRERATVLADMEEEGDAITHNIIMLLHRTFATPLDREDISAVAHALDDIANRITPLLIRCTCTGLSSPPTAPASCVMFLLMLSRKYSGV
jgi:uncharacterized protein Yka (UPF0111/DUF47 family)